MKKMIFLSRLMKERKLQLVEPSEEIKEAYIIKSDSNLVSAKILFQNNRFEEAVGLAYYSMYHLLTALLFKIGIKSENHTASIFLLKEIFGINNKEILEAKKERIDKQYYVDFKITRTDVEDMIIKAERFNKILIDFISKLNKMDVEMFRNNLMEVLR